MYDVVIQGGTLVDGTGHPVFQADLAIQDDRIAQIGEVAAADGQQVIDARGKWVTPGFIDVHTHMDGWLLKTPLIESKLRQGFSTEVIMSDGISYAPVAVDNAHEWIYYLQGLNALQQEDYTGWESLSDYLALLDGCNAQNVLTQIPYANVRVLACGWSGRPPDDYQIQEIQSRIQRGMEQGACGLSSGLDYIAQCFASTRELIEACAMLKAWGGLYATHVRYKKGTLDGVREAVRIGRESGAKVHISHLKGNDEEERDAILAYIDQEAVHEVDFSFDVYPYLPGSTMLNYLMPLEAFHGGPLPALHALSDPRLRSSVEYAVGTTIDLAHTTIAWVPSKANSRWQGETLQSYVDASSKSPGAALCDFLIEEKLAVLLVFHRGDDKLVEEFIRHPCFVLGTDGIYHPDAHVHPRQFGSTPRLLNTYVQNGVWSLPDAVHAMTGRTAQRFGLRDRGQLTEGQFADVVVIDPAAFHERNSFAEPAVMAVGVDHMWVNGKPVIADRSLVERAAGAYPGRALKFKQ